MKTKKAHKTIWLLSSLLILSFAFYVAAQESSTTQNIFLDSDQDGLTDEEEKLYGTDAHKSDTDGDGYSDGAEVKAGYNPLIPAPGDRLTDFQITKEKELTNVTDAKNLTDEISEKIAALPTDKEISVEDIQSIVDESLSAENVESQLPEISKEDIKIRKQKYGKYSDDEAKKRRKEDFSEYIASIFYIFTSNSPVPITSGSDVGSGVSQIFQKIMVAVSTQNPDMLSDISSSGERMLKQLYEVEVPEDLADFHIKALRYAMYAQGLKSLLKPNPQDPLSEIANLSKVEAFIQSLMSFSTDFESILNKSELDYSDIQDKVKDYGIDLPDADNLNLNLGSSENQK